MKKLEEEVIQSFGVSVVYKKSPFGIKPGYLDPEEKKLLSADWPEENDKKDMPPLNELVKIWRQSMGFPNLNLNKQEIITKYEEISFEGNPVELWRYYKRRGEEKNKPCFIYFHGGGWVGGTPYVAENPCKFIAELSDAVVFNIGYSLAPEKPFPNGFNDCYHTVEHVYKNAELYGIDKNRISIGGDSAGGNYVAAVTLRAREENPGMIHKQFLLYPCTARADAMVDGYEWKERDFIIAPEEESLIRPFLGLGRPEKFENDFMNVAYMQPEDITNPYVSPMLAQKHDNLPEAYIFVAEFDGLRTQGEFYGYQLQKSGVPVKVYRYQGMTHAFLDRLGYVVQSEDVCREIANAIKNK